MIINDLVFFILYTCAVGFLTRVLMIDHAWPFQDLDNFPTGSVTDGDNLYPMDMMHRLKRLLGVYRATDDGLWEPRSTVLWTCAYCLGFWVNMPAVGLAYALGAFELRWALAALLAVPFIVGYVIER